ncbi:uncharacterized protein LOC110975336 [Acanthaster planci]|uniref:Uncharacterized protein LOC110975336 n=1 Tax=Acanthaster planci TaxID=133434 RepID=A0A8B7XTU7_ACAPL|nr:uncharacterized protein LOC110975336 [Acanthaster planci]
MTTLHTVGMAQPSQATVVNQQPPQQTITYQTVQAQPKPADTVVSTYNVATARQTGYVQLVCGVLTVGLGIAAIVMECNYAWVASPIWSGMAFFIVAGILGIASAANQNNCVIIAHLVMSILASLVAFQLMCIMIVAGLAEVNAFCNREYNIFGFYDQECWSNGGCIAVDSIGGLVALIELIVAIVASAICCRSGCGSGTVATQQTVVHHYVPNSGNVTIMTNPQPYGQGMAPQQGYIQPPSQPGAPPQAYNNQGFHMAPQTSGTAPAMHAPPPYSCEDKMPIPQS